MVPISQETNIEVLRQYSLWLEAQVQELTTELSKVRDHDATGQQEWINAELRDQLTRLRKKYFGFGRESIKSNQPRPIGHEQQKLKMHGKRLHTQDAAVAKENLENKDDECERDKIEHDFAALELKEESIVRGITMGGENAWAKMNGFYQESTEITVVERIYKKVTHRQAKYRLKDEYNTTGKEVIITAPGPVKLKPGTQYSVDFALSVVSDKYEYHLPLERQRRKMEAAGFDVDVKTLYSMCKMVAEHCEGAVLQNIRRDILNDFCAAHVDESPWIILGAQSKSYMWVL